MRCEMMTVVLCPLRAFMAARMRASVRVSTAERESSNMITGVSAQNTSRDGHALLLFRPKV